MTRFWILRPDNGWRWPLIFFTLTFLLLLSRTNPLQVAAKLSGILAGRRIVVDPGHGGPDPGAISQAGAREKTLVLEIALTLRLLLGRAGVYVQLTRADDRDFGGDEWGSMLRRKRLDLSYRAELANRSRAEAFLSIHANSIGDARWSGAQVFYNEGRAFARELAVYIQKAFDTHLSPGYRQAKSADYRILNETKMPAVVIEVGFLSNPGEAALLAQAEYRKKVAEAIYQGVIQYFIFQSSAGARTMPVLVPLASLPDFDLSRQR